MMSVNLSREEFAKEFGRRTIENLKTYDGDYEQTQLINSLIGLPVLPKETFYQDAVIKDKRISRELLLKLQTGIAENAIEDEDLDVPNLHVILRHIRNAICHGGILFKGEYPVTTTTPVQINKIQFTDNYDDGYEKHYFTIDVTPNDLLEVVKAVFGFTTQV